MPSAGFPVCRKLKSVALAAVISDVAGGEPGLVWARHVDGSEGSFDASAGKKPLNLPLIRLAERILAIDRYIGCKFQGAARGEANRDRSKTDRIHIATHKT